MRWRRQGSGSGAGTLCAFHPRIHESLPMTQNVISIDIPAELLARLDAALDAIESVTDIFEPISEEQMRALAKMGDRLEPFCRLAATVLPQYPQALPPSFSVAELQRDLAAFDALRPRVQRLAKALEKSQDTLTALGSDVYAGARDGYTLMKAHGESDGLDLLRASLPDRSPRLRPAKPDPAA